MSDKNSYIPPKIWQWNTNNEGNWANINRPTAGATHNKVLEKGKHPFQLYSLATPNGVKVTIMFEELLAAGVKEAEYDAHLIKIGDSEQFGSGFVAVNPNSKIPALVDRSGEEPVNVFESGNILFYLAEKFGLFLPKEGAKRVEVMNWLFWLQGSGPYLGGGFGHFYAYPPEKFEYPINRYAMETKRLFDVADKRLSQSEYLGGKDYTIADIASWPWLSPFVTGGIYGEARKFLSIHEYTHVERWVKPIAERPAVRRGRIVNKTWGEEDTQMLERHSAADFEGKSL